MLHKNLICKQFIEAFTKDSPNVAQENVLKYLRSAFLALDQGYNLEKLSFSLESKEPLYIHENNNIQRQIYNEILDDCHGDDDLARSKSQAGRVYKYWKVIAKKKSVTIHPERYQLDMEKYRQGLFNCIKPELEVYGMSESEIDQLEAELVGGSGQTTITQK